MTSPSVSHHPEPNSSFLTEIPYLQHCWDSTSIGSFKTCPRLYYYQIICGYQSHFQSIHLTFGLLYHSSLEWYDHEKFKGKSHEEAVHSTVRKILVDTWDFKLSRPIEMDSNNKTRQGLILTVIWYLDQFENDSLQTIILANGKPGIELSFRMETDFRAPTGQNYLLAGHMDKVAEMGGKYYVVDRKTTATTLSQSYFDKYSPDNQFSLYSLAGKVIYSDKMAGIIVDAAQIAVSFSRFQRQQIPRNDSILEEWLADFGSWLKFAEYCAINETWPMNDKSCSMYGGCSFRQICTKPESIREPFLRERYRRRMWNPLVTRGDV